MSGSPSPTPNLLRNLAPPPLPSRSLWAAIRACIRQVRRPFVLNIVLGGIYMVATIVAPIAVGHSIDALADGDVRQVYQWCGLLAGAALVAGVSVSWQYLCFGQLWIGTALPIMHRSSHHSCQVGAGLPSRKETGEALSVITSDSNRVAGMLDGIATGVSVLITFVVMVAVTMSFSWRLGLTVLAGIPVTMGLLALFARVLHGRQTAARKATGQLTTTATEGIGGLRVLRAIGAEDYLRGRYQKDNQHVRHTGIRLSHTTGVFLGFEHFLAPALLAVIVFQGYLEVMAGRMTAGQLITFCGFTAVLVTPFRLLVQCVTSTTRGMVGLRNVRDLFGLPTRDDLLGRNAKHSSELPVADLTDTATGVVIEPGSCTMIVSDKPQLSASLLHRLARIDANSGTDQTVGTDDSALSGQDVCPEESLSITKDANLGDGAGPGQGAHTILVGAEPLEHWPVGTIRQSIMLSDAEPHLTAGSLRQQVDPLRRHTDAECLTALQVAHGQDILDALPDGLDDRITEKGRSLSGGQRQRVALARAVLLNPETLLLVEPTSAVDTHTEGAIAERLSESRTGRRTVIASTSPLIAQHCDTITIVTDTEVVSGSFATMCRHPLFHSIVLRHNEPPDDPPAKTIGVTAHQEVHHP